MKAEKIGFPLRFETAKQKNAITKIANKNSRSLNAEILHMINLKILESRTKGTANISQQGAQC